VGPANLGERRISGAASRSTPFDAPLRQPRHLRGKRRARSPSRARWRCRRTAGHADVLRISVAIWRIQAQLVSDIAGLYGKDLQLTRSHMVYCLFRACCHQFTARCVVPPAAARVPSAFRWAR